jgi:hypothetical protein
MDMGVNTDMEMDMDMCVNMDMEMDMNMNMEMNTDTIYYFGSKRNKTKFDPFRFCFSLLREINKKTGVSKQIETED